MKAVTVKKRHRLRRKEIKHLEEELENTFGMRFELGVDTDRAHTNMGFDIVFCGHDLRAMVVEESVFLTVSGLLEHRPDTRWVTVDMGAVKFVYNGADVMAPGIVDASPEVEKDMLVWIRDERNGQPLAIGRALMSGNEMVIGQTGKGIKSLHHIGDPLWELGSVK